jgi:glutathione S-transferase
MAMLQLYIGNKNYSSWSLRPWLLMRESGIDFTETRLRLDFQDGSPFKRMVLEVNPALRVPVLVDDGFAVWDSLAIVEYLAEKFPERSLWPRERRQRARARSLCAEMHSGFGALRSNCPMNIEASLPEVGERLLRENADLRRDLQRIVDMWTQQLEACGGPFLFGEFGTADAYFAPVTWRITGYALPVPALVARYVDAVHALPAMREWSDAARAEHDFLADDEPYRSTPRI